MPPSDLIDEYIELNPNRPGPANARLREYGVPVWALVGDLEAVHGDLDRVAAEYTVPLDAVRAAVAYDRRHQAVIDARRGVDVACTVAILLPEDRSSLRVDRKLT